MIEHIGLIAGLAILIIAALRGFSIILASIIASLVVAITNHMPLADALIKNYAIGPLGGFTFAGSFFLLFVTGAVFGRMLAETNAAQALAVSMMKRVGTDRGLWVIAGAFAILTYGGVSVFIVIFALYPLGVEIIRSANIPKRLFCGAAVLGSGTFTMTALPGSPSIHNVISAEKLGTSLTAGAGLGLLAAAIMVALGMAYLERERKRAAARGEAFVPAPNDFNIDESAVQVDSSLAQALVPLAVVITLILGPRFLKSFVTGDGAATNGFANIIAFANSQPVLWPSFALVLGTFIVLFMHRPFWRSAAGAANRGAHDAILPLINTAVVVGFGGVVAQTEGFASFAKLALDAPAPPLVSMVLSVNVVSGIVGSASGGLRIFMETLAPAYLEKGIPAEQLHRIATVAAGGLDTLPHCGAVVAAFTIMGLTHLQAYRDVFIVSVVIPLIATIVIVAVAMLL